MKQSIVDAILDAPALAPPPGVTANFENPRNLSHPELAVLQLVVATAVVGMRVYTKLGVVRKMLAEDCECHSPEWRVRLTCCRLVDRCVALLCWLPYHCLHV